MKSCLLSLALFFFLLSCDRICAQESGARGFLLGFNASRFSGSETTMAASAYLPGLSIGFFREFQCTEQLVLGPEISFTTKGSLLRTVGDLNLHQVITYMELPLLTSWIFMPGKKTRIYVTAGPTLDLMLLAFNEVGFPEDISRFDLGLLLGSGIRWSKIRLRIHVNQGLLDLDRSPGAGLVKNRTFSCALGLTF